MSFITGSSSTGYACLQDNKNTILSNTNCLVVIAVLHVVVVVELVVVVVVVVVRAVASL